VGKALIADFSFSVTGVHYGGKGWKGFLCCGSCIEKLYSHLAVSLSPVGLGLVLGVKKKNQLQAE
jgi:hypothetical protein